MELEDALKHLSEHYFDSSHDCDICKEIQQIFNEYEYNVPLQWWDYDD